MIMSSRGTAAPSPPAPAEFDVILAGGEGQFVEFKEAVSDTLARELVAFANSGGGRSYMSLLVDEPTKARQLLEKAGYACSSRTVLVVRVPDEPGALAGLARKLGGAGVDIQSVVHLETMGDHVQLAIGVDNLDKARSLV